MLLSLKTNEQFSEAWDVCRFGQYQLKISGENSFCFSDCISEVPVVGYFCVHSWSLIHLCILDAFVLHIFPHFTAGTSNPEGYSSVFDSKSPSSIDMVFGRYIPLGQMRVRVFLPVVVEIYPIPKIDRPSTALTVAMTVDNFPSCVVTAVNDLDCCFGFRGF